MSGGTRAAILFGLAVSASLIAPEAARADDPEPSAPPPSIPVASTTSTTVFPSAPPSPGAGDLAGTAAGAGRRHPGRAAEPSPATSAEAEGRKAAEEPVPKPAPPRAPARRAAPERPRHEASGADRERVMRVLPLGTGMALTGLGLGFIALRLRRR
ncbi:hypothetical protein J1792_05725 [Streptomyces triculaminicus]|uniref:Gram-positive cocci surface proteins LPxTG domain-containing protein n=1 Tax=Streptomyces triculaminicus TaxID=2816232 RepID=A0A939JQ87_9ACTN|nr:hypothetical protein [Streptomyces triculaminicus]MBO0652304.1 hypothetical protein [Streptomyces triculaminicus]